MDPRPPADPALLTRLAAELDGLQRQVASMSHTVSLLQQAGPIAPPQPQPYPYQPAQPYPPQQYQLQQYQPQQPWRPSPQPAREPWWEREGVVSRLLAVAGAGVTLIGVVLMVVLAAQAGWFGPLARVIAGAVLSALLVAIAFRVRERPGGQVGGVALAATGIAGAYLDVIAATTIYEWFVPIVGLAIALVIAAGGLALASKWEALALAQIVIVGVALLAPVITGDVTPTLIAFLIILQAVGWGAQWTNNWPSLHLTRTAPVVIAMIAAIISESSERTQSPYLVLAGAVVVALVGAATSIASVLHRPEDTTAGIVLGIAAIPLLCVGALFERNGLIAIEAGAAVLLLGIAVMPKLNNAARVSAAVAGAVAILEICFNIPGDGGPSIAVSIAAIGFIAASMTPQGRAFYWVGGAFSVLSILVFGVFASIDELTNARLAVEKLGGTTVVAAVLLIATLVFLVWQGSRLGVIEDRSLQAAVAALAIAAVYAFTAAAVAVGTGIGGTGGFTAGHCAATVGWMLAATVILLYGLKTPTAAHLALLAGLTLASAAVAKLFLFDLAMLSGLTRALAFLGVGLLLLAAGTKYARAFAERREAA